MDISSLIYGDNDQDSRNKMAAQIAALRQQSAAPSPLLGELALFAQGRRAIPELSRNWSQQATDQENLINKLPEMQQQYALNKARVAQEQAQTQKLQDEAAAMNAPETQRMLVQTVKAMGMDVDPNTPARVLKETLAALERGAAYRETARHNKAMEGLAGAQVRIDPVTGQPYLTHSGGGRGAAGLPPAPLSPNTSVGTPGAVDATSGDTGTPTPSVPFRGPKQIQQDQKRQDDLSKRLGEALDPYRVRGGLKNYMDAINRSHKITALIVDPETGLPRKMLDSRDMVDLAMALQALVGAGHASETEVQQLIPKTWWGSVAKAEEYFTNHPADVGQQAFATKMLHSADREAQVNKNTVTSAILARIPEFYGPLAKLNKKHLDVQLKGHGLNPDAFDENGLLKEGASLTLTGPGTKAPSGGAAHPQDEQAIKWAKDNPDDPRAAQILRANGVTP